MLETKLQSSVAEQADLCMPPREKTCVQVRDKVKHKPACLATENSKKIEISVMAT